tara:strand:+ start:587 stop:3364 length:2778 start_codon:yes stop_codon:yes gene_type:complete
MHKLLKRQLKQLGDEHQIPQEFLDAVNAAYNEFDEDINRSDLILDNSLNELNKANEELKELAKSKAQEAESLDEKLQEIIESVSEIVFQIDLNGNFLFLNSSWDKITQSSREKAIHTKITRYIHPDDFSKIKRNWDELKSGKKNSCESKYRLKNSSGEYRWVHMKSRAIYVNKNIHHITGTIADIHENYLVEQENQRLALIARKTQNLIILADKEGKIEWVNHAFEHITQYKLEEVIGKKPGSILQGYDTDPETVKKISETLQKNESFTGEIINYNKPGHPYWLELRIDPITNDNGENTGFIAVESVITKRKERERSLNLLTSLFEVSNEAFQITDDLGNFLFINNQLCKNLGYTHDELKYKKLQEIELKFHQEGRWEEFINDLESEPEGVSAEGTNIRKDGSQFPVEVRVKLVTIDDFRYVVAIVRDVTERKEQQRELLKINARQNALLKNLNAGIMVEDENRKIVLINQKLLEYFNSPVSAEDMLGVDCEIGAEDSKYLFEDGDLFVKRINKLVKEKKQVLEEEIVFADGRIMERDYIPLFVDNEYYGHMWQYKDVTERVINQRKIEESEEKYRSLIENLDLGLIEVDNEGTVVNVFSGFCKLVGYTEEEMMGSSPADYLLDDFGKSIYREAQEIRRLGQPSVYEQVLIHKNGTPIWVLISATPTYDEKGNVIGSIGVHMNITDKRDSELRIQAYAHELEAINKELDQFAYIVSHDLKAPLRAINNLSIWIEEDLGEHFEGDIKENFTLLRGRVGRMENLINGILQYSRAGRLKYKNERTDVNVLVQEISESTILKENSGVKILNQLPVFYTEKIALQQVFSNLISNGIKYNSKDNQVIEISCVDKKDHYEFTVKDNGDGIEPEFHDKIFQIFQTLNARDKVESTGVGLAIVKKILDEKKCSISLESEINVGSTFTFEWPKSA